MKRCRYLDVIIGWKKATQSHLHQPSGDSECWLVVPLPCDTGRRRSRCWAHSHQVASPKLCRSFLWPPGSKTWTAWGVSSPSRRTLLDEGCQGLPGASPVKESVELWFILMIQMQTEAVSIETTFWLIINEISCDWTVRIPGCPPLSGRVSVPPPSLQCGIWARPCLRTSQWTAAHHHTPPGSSSLIGWGVPAPLLADTGDTWGQTGEMIFWDFLSCSSSDPNLPDVS